jgi:Leucine-rich repeat (LRR) protein
MKTEAKIDSDYYRIYDKEFNQYKGITGLNFDSNKKIEFLPIDIGSYLRGLEALSAYDCAITSIKRENFMNLVKLKYLSLDNNNIERIESDTFSNLHSLEHVRIGKRTFVIFV